MTDQEDHDHTGTMSVKDMQSWLQHEIRDSAKAHELRVKGATEFVTAYAEGRLTPEQAEAALVRHDHRWGEALFGASAAEGTPDNEILNAIDRARDTVLRGYTARTKPTDWIR
jgi:hypothetical protein